MQTRRPFPPCLLGANSYSNGKRITNPMLKIVSTRTKFWLHTINLKIRIDRRRKTLSKLSLTPAKEEPSFQLT